MLYIQKRFFKHHHGHNTWHDYAFLDGTNFIKISTIFSWTTQEIVYIIDPTKTYSKAQMVGKIPIFLTCNVFRPSKNSINEFFLEIGTIFSLTLCQMWYTHQFYHYSLDMKD